ncbi:N-acetylmuramoyl-L-alanine amidase (plasmid) [Clostridium botulinum A2B3 87]|uniref:N-acetylmuramoyl-L-alanine amidase n=1 Tax=Clostridium botulinum TaxID=1491 RepID=UPI0004A56CF1|nr:N-acetylmuramoyl-L-alanine amidase [Clostridium botulinum]KEI94417.1 N-acetylmuramoyl-L-alanine amidase [Clostridium botulinum A2B3 87]
MNINNANLSFGDMAYGNNPQEIDLHHAEKSSCNVYDVHSWHKGNGWAGIGYHYFVRKNGEIWKGRPDNAIGAHVAEHNTNTLGICAEGSYMSEDMPQAQKNAIIELCKYLCNKYGINKIYGHREVGSSNCPGTKYPLAEIRNTVFNGGGSNVINSNNDGSSYNVKDIQSMLIKIGYPVGSCGADGIMGTGTITAIKAFQRDCNLAVDGIVGNATYTKIKTEYNKKVNTQSKPTINNNPSWKDLDGGTGVINTPSGVNVRADKSTNSKILGTLPNGAKVQLYRKEGDWMHIYYPPHGGYVYAKYIRY